MLQPAKSKYRKQFRGSMKGNAQRGNYLAFGEYGIKAMSGGWVTAAQIESARRTITHATKRQGKLFLRVFPHKPYTKKGAGARMGSGKADIHGYVAVIRPGAVLFELSGVELAVAQEAIRLAGHKLSVKTKFIQR